MSDIRVRIGQQSDLKVRIGQQNAIKVIASNAPSGTFLDKLENVADVNINDRADNTVLIYDSIEKVYKHVDPAQILDLADAIDNQSIDFGTF